MLSFIGTKLSFLIDDEGAVEGDGFGINYNVNSIKYSILVLRNTINTTTEVKNTSAADRNRLSRTSIVRSLCSRVFVKLSADLRSYWCRSRVELILSSSSVSNPTAVSAWVTPMEIFWRTRCKEEVIARASWIALLLPPPPLLLLAEAAEDEDEDADDGFILSCVCVCVCDLRAHTIIVLI
jgi:hypothetical protein